MIISLSHVRAWLATGHTDMLRIFEPCAFGSRELGAGSARRDFYVFRGRRSDLTKIIWHDAQGVCLFTKQLERSHPLWPSLADGVPNQQADAEIRKQLVE
jgi:transposase